MMSAEARRRTILIADPDLEVARQLKKGLQDNFEILVARDGSKALELSVLRYPDLIMFYRNCPLIGATQFLRILRSNPRTEEIPLIVLSDEEVVVMNTGYLDGVLVKPLNLDEVRAHITQVFRRSDAVREVGHEGGAVSGSLEQISMADLLQVFAMNRRTGMLQLQSGTVSAEVYVRDGRIEEALCGGTRGEKALYRLIGFRAGQFSFSPGRTAPSVSIDSATDALLIEGMRQADELERVRTELPPSFALLEQVVARDEVPEGLHPVTAELLQALPNAPRVADLIDRSSATD
ncbi:MAG: response regulator, partial [Clostridia bacterium]|nr:response regulator [Deltaproteobacteria bacterium]